ncbi:MAG: ABC transporter ATP-binding protein [Actinomycetota bacterium]|nr:ABC transporter ATP-binding protein [Actinomycetota bacterium]
MTSIVRATALVKVYGETSTPAVNGVDFDIRDRECFGFLGPNGAGKTTIMRMVCCRAQRNGGDLAVLGLDPSTDERAIKSSIGVVPQETNLDEALTVEENLAVYARYFGIPRRVSAPRVRDLLRFVQLEDRAEWNVAILSGGMKRRLLIARALVNEPRLLILDEPTTGLDPQARHLVWEKLRDLKRRGVTLVITTHYMEEAAQLCDRLVIMHQGRILVEGEPSALVYAHVAPEVVELSPETPDGVVGLLNEVSPLADSHEVTGDLVILHTDNGEALLKSINDAGIRYARAAFRRATLEDVFLKLTGRRLEE